MNALEYYLAIDQGGHASRAMVFDQNANIICQSEYSIETQTPKPGWVEHDPEQLIEATFRAIQSCLQTLGADKKRVKAAGLATQRSSIVCWNRDSGAALSAVVSWQDRRQAEWLKQFQGHNETIHRKTGLFLSPHYGASKIRWCLDTIAAVKQAQKNGHLAIGPLASFLAFRLLRQRPMLADPANASRTLLWNIATQDWDEDLLRLFGIDKAILPPCHSSRNNFGQLNIDGSNIPMTVMTGDQSAALFAWGTPTPQSIYINMGTGAFVQRPLDEYQSSHRMLTSLVYQDETYHCYSREGSVNGAARALQWFAEKFAIAEIEKQVTDCLSTAVTPPLFINTVAGLGSPDWQAQIEPQFIGEGDSNSKLLAVIESIVFLIQRNLDAMAGTNHTANNIIISGGLATLDGLSQLIADLSGLDVLRPQEHEASATGLAYLIAARPKNWPALQQVKTFTPDKNLPLKQRYQQWSTALDKIIADIT
ncbi:MAG TPA: hypothetical protein ENJ65_05475 [Candidatus Tenderia electrophaga]|uniref:Glycerol kinase n=1 Tax=Candidatus Tenderia electrophaga TaxID=1748243 RepID=A0A832J7E1_9GAMM|nr:hypothetical protein [Candidatus Tenderia electrophaga]